MIWKVTYNGWLYLAIGACAVISEATERLPHDRAHAGAHDRRRQSHSTRSVTEGVDRVLNGLRPAKPK